MFWGFLNLAGPAPTSALPDSTGPSGPSGPPSSVGALESGINRSALAELTALILEEVEAIRARWHAKELPKLKAKASRIWKAARRNGGLGGGGTGVRGVGV